MNSHVPLDIQNKYPNINFKGKPRIIKNRKVIKAVNPTTGMNFYYSFDEDFFWLTNCGIPDWFVTK